MRIRLSVFAIAVIVIVNAWLLAGVAWNRTGEPERVLSLTERELALPYGHWAQRENTGVALSIRTAGRHDAWLGRDKLLQLGFDVAGQELSGAADRRRPLARRVYVVLEFDGPAFEGLLAAQREELEAVRANLDSDEASRRQVENARAALERLQQGASRLVAIDASREADALHERYPDRNRYAVMPARVRMHRVRRPGSEQSFELQGRIETLLPQRVHVPHRFHATLLHATEEGRALDGSPPRYRVRLAFGRSDVPWVIGVESVSEGQASGGS